MREHDEEIQKLIKRYGKCLNIQDEHQITNYTTKSKQNVNPEDLYTYKMDNICWYSHLVNILWFYLHEYRHLDR